MAFRKMSRDAIIAAGQASAFVIELIKSSQSISFGILTT
jgi:hypothetical protein